MKRRRLKRNKMRWLSGKKTERLKMMRLMRTIQINLSWKRCRKSLNKL
jgi:hypothetical protein